MRLPPAIAAALTLLAGGEGARAQSRCVQGLGWRSVDCPAEGERGPDRAEGAFRRSRGESPGARSTGPVVPGAAPGLLFLPPTSGPAPAGPLSPAALHAHADGAGGHAAPP